MSANNLKFLDFEVYPKWWCLTVSDEEESYDKDPSGSSVPNGSV